MALAFRTSQRSSRRSKGVRLSNWISVRRTCGGDLRRSYLLGRTFGPRQFDLSAWRSWRRNGKSVVPVKEELTKHSSKRVVADHRMAWRWIELAPETVRIPSAGATPNALVRPWLDGSILAPEHGGLSG